MDQASTTAVQQSTRLFRSIALEYGPRCIGVVLTGRHDDGNAGLRAIKDCGGTAIVQDPSEADDASMPQSALQAREVDYVMRLSEMPDLFDALAHTPAAHAMRRDKPQMLEIEHFVGTGRIDASRMIEIGAPTEMT